VQALEPVVAVALVYVAVLAHRRGTAAGSAGPLTHGRVVAGGAAFLVLGLALGPPLDGWAVTNLAAHMLQHVVLLSVVPPLLLLGRVPAVVTAAVPGPTRAWIARRTRALVRAGRAVPAPLAAALAICLQALALAVWHVPRLYDDAVANNAVHAAEHLTFLGVGLVFWWSLFALGGELGIAWAVLSLFVATLPATLLGVLMSFSTTPWYPRYTTGTVAQAVTRQQLAGVVMWAFGGTIAVVSAAALFAVWLARMERATPARPHWEAAR
jgi:putative membrane protein